MGHIKEPDGIDFVVENKPLKDDERKQISEIIAYFKATGQKTGLLPINTFTRQKQQSKKEVEKQRL